jgi:MoaA/NifB/PqqE/SkfB family radical SAM enzyme
LKGINKMRLEEIGFYTLTDERAKNVSVNSPLYRCELLITSRCNFDCVYCRKRTCPDITLKEAINIIKYWSKEGLKNIRFSGGEPTLHKNLSNMVRYAKSNNIQRIAISTNGSASLNLYDELINSGVNDFSISLDSCCSDVGNAISKSDKWQHTVDVIKYVSKKVYTTVGIVLFEKNIDEIEDLLKFASGLGVSDMRIITAAQWNKPLKLDIEIGNYPILKYRLNNIKNNRNVRGIGLNDNHKCPLVLDDMAVEGNYHYPCIIHLREGGNPIGKISENIRQERLNWYETHDCYNDPICKNNCLDVCVDYNNKVFELKESKI